MGGIDCVVILTDHSHLDYARVVELSSLVVDTRNATRTVLRAANRLPRARRAD